MKIVNLATRDIEAINALYEEMDAITRRIDSLHYNGMVVDWKCVTTMHIGVCRKHLADSKNGIIDIVTATELIYRLAQAYALTDFTLSSYSKNWPYRNDLQEFADRCNRLNAGIKIAVKNS